MGKDDAKIWGEYPHNTHLSWVTAIYLMVMSFLKEIVMTIFSTIPIKIEGKREAVTRSAFFLILFMVVHAIGNLHFFLKARNVERQCCKQGPANTCPALGLDVQ